MEIKFDKQYLAELYYKGKTNDKKHRFQPQIIRKYQRCIDLLEAITEIERLYQYHALNYEVLRGDKIGVSSIRVNMQYRIEFIVEMIETESIVTICNILELSNHYK